MTSLGQVESTRSDGKLTTWAACLKHMKNVALGNMNVHNSISNIIPTSNRRSICSGLREGGGNGTPPKLRRTLSREHWRRLTYFRCHFLVKSLSVCHPCMGMEKIKLWKRGCIHAYIVTSTMGRFRKNQYAVKIAIQLSKRRTNTQL